MDDWIPDETKKVKADREHIVHLWIVPAQVAGVWQWSMAGAGVNDRYTLMLKQKFQNVSGTLTINGKESTISSLKLRGGEMSFDTAFNHFDGKVEGNRIRFQTVHNGKEFVLTATRGPAGVALAN
jgi:hypothetical protein